MRRALASARTQDGREVAGYRDELVVDDRRLRWEEILSADWDSESDTLTIMLVEPEVLAVELDEPARLLQLVRERITASVVLTRRVPVDGRRGFTVMARRPPSGGEITVAVEYDRGLDPDDPGVRDTAVAAVRQVRAEVGL